MQALLLSASKVGNTPFLQHAIPFIDAFLGTRSSDKPLRVLFVPYAGVSFSYDEYTHRVSTALSDLNVTVNNIDDESDKHAAVESCDVIMVGGGNTFHLLDQLYKNDLLTIFKQKLAKSGKYIGWSAGSNIAGLSIKTTNDMPIVQPSSFDALGLIPFQINPHYTDYQPPGFNGETREMRLQEFMVVNPDVEIIGIQEGTALLVNQQTIRLVGDKNGYRFKGGIKTEITPNSVVV